MEEHGGKIFCYNGQRGGAVFRVELAAMLSPLPSKDPQQLPSHAEKAVTGKV